MSRGLEPAVRDRDAAPQRRLLGSYYTPEHLAAVLAGWALSDGGGPVLDPSYGGCAFLEASARVLSENGCPGAGDQVYGVDIDPRCADVACESSLLNEANCFAADFLSLTPIDLPDAPYAAIVGNPPYVRHHWITDGQRESARAVAAESSTPLPATASLWAYFLLHSLRFLSRGGRLAFLLPEAVLQADYASPLRKMLAERFARTRLIHLRDRQFAHTDEAVVALACSGFGEPGELEVSTAESVDDLRIALTAPAERASTGFPFPPAIGRAGRRALESLCRLREHPLVKPLGDVALIRVGVVTGANRHFIRSGRDLDALGVPAGARRRIVSRARWLDGLRFTQEDYAALARAGAPVLLVRPEGPEHDRAVLPWIREGVEGGVDRRYKCSIRDDWFRVDVPAPPHAFATCARAGSPILVLNHGSCLNSNAIHSVRWKPALDVPPAAAVVGFLTSVGALWAELHGRRYGGGVLKMEPGTLRGAPVPLVAGAETIFDDVDRLFREGREEEARGMADASVLQRGLGMDANEIGTLRSVRDALAEWRRPRRPVNGHG